MLLNEYIELFESLAISNTDIAHSETKKTFFKKTTSELLSGLVDCDAGYVMAIEIPKPRINEKYSDNKLDVKHGAFNILTSCSSNETDEMTDKQSECERIARQVLAKLKMMQQDYEDNQIKMMPLEDIDMDYIDPSQFSGLCGFRVEFQVYSSEPSNFYDTDKWL